MNLENRIGKIEQAAGIASGCPECCHIEGGRIEFTIRENHVSGGKMPLQPTPLPEPERCGSCGRITVFTFTITHGGQGSDDAAG